MANLRPYVAVAAVCERVLQEQDGVVSAIRIVDTLTVTIQPLPTPEGTPPITTISVVDLVLLIALKAGAVTGEHRIAIVMNDPNGKTVPLPPGESPVVLKGNDGVNLVLRFGLRLNAPVGQYWFDVLWDGESLTKIPLSLQREESIAVTEPRPH